MKVIASVTTWTWLISFGLAVLTLAARHHPATGPRRVRLRFRRGMRVDRRELVFVFGYLVPGFVFPSVSDDTWMGLFPQLAKHRLERDTHRLTSRSSPSGPPLSSSPEAAANVASAPRRSPVRATATSATGAEDDDSPLESSGLTDPVDEEFTGSDDSSWCFPRDLNRRPNG